MCGIFCVFKNKYYPIIIPTKQSSRTLQSRGPDCSAFLNHLGNYLYFYRLCIMDTSPLGNQPFVSGNIACMCNGEIYNYRSLVDEYKLECTGNSDCEVILRLYEKLGNFPNVVNLLDGVFSIVLIDNDKHWIARDYIGVRPLFIGKTMDGHIMVASLAKTITPFCDDVQPVKPGTIKMVSSRINTIYNSSINLGLVVSRPRDILYNILEGAVRKRLMADRPIGCLLSGGLDSSIIACLLCNLIGSKNVRTYSVGMKDSLDLKYAKKVAEYLGTTHKEVIFTPEDGLSLLPQIIYDTETYDVTTIRASTPMWILCKWITDNTSDTVIFSGEGSDELFCGYLYFHNAPSPMDASQESDRLIKNLYLYDVLRADRAVSCHGLELRVPFLDRDVYKYSRSLSPDQLAPSKGWEKLLLREAFVGKLPDEVLWRRKNGLSDGCGSVGKPWYGYIEKYVDSKLGDELYDEDKYMSKEHMYYKLIFDKYFPNYNLNIDMWMPKWSGNMTNPSGMLISAFDEKDISNQI